MDAERPPVTMALIAFNQSRFIVDAVRGAFAQDYPRLQIILSDDASTDETFEWMEKLAAEYSGPHQLVLNRNTQNLGIGGHINRIMALAVGEIIVIGAGDDISDANRVQTVADAFAAATEPTFSVWSAARYVDEWGQRVARHFPAPAGAFTDRTMVRNIRPLIGATHAWRREVFDFFGPLLPDIMFEDNAISFRSHLLGAIAYIDRELVSYRTHAGNIANFTKPADARQLYAHAARRAAWAQTGIEQRRKDLDCAMSKGAMLRDMMFLKVELEEQGRMFARRRRSYEKYPEIPKDVLLAAFRDIEVAKVVARALLHRLQTRLGGTASDTDS